VKPLPDKDLIPPALAAKLLKFFAGSNDYDCVAGDLTETYEYIAEAQGLAKANRWFWIEVVKSLPGFMKNRICRNTAMVGNYFKIALRNIGRNRLFAIINAFGLAVGMACFILITLWVRDELSYDTFHANKDNLYLLTIVHPNDVVDPNVPYALAPRLSAEFPEIAHYTRIYELGNIRTCMFEYHPEEGPPIMFYENNVNLVDSSFFSMFSFPFKYGDSETALKSPNSLVITDRMAAKYFGSLNPLGKILTFNNSEDLVISGVIHIPSNSHIQPDFIAFLPYKWEDNWNWSDPSYILLEKKTSAEDFKEKIVGAMSKYNPYPNSDKFRVDLMPMNKVHLDFGRRTYVYIFSVIAVFILIIACVNYMNLATACSANRTREVGLRKVMGAMRIELIQQFLGESLLMSALALALSLILVRIGLPLINDLTSKKLTFSLLFSPSMGLFLLGLIAAVALVSGIYPAFFLSAKKLVNTLKAPAYFRSGRSSFRVVTVVGQFAISVLLIASTTVVFRQLNYIQNRPLGFKTDYVIKMPINQPLLSRFLGYKNKLLQNPRILSVTAGQDVPFNEDYKTSGVEWDGKDPGMVDNVRYNISHFDYIETFGMEMVDGRSFNRNSFADTANFVINEEAARYMGMEKPVGKRLRFWGREGIIIGVVKDYHHVSLHREIMPQVFTVNPKYFNALKYVFIKIAKDNIPETLEYIREASFTFAPDYPYEYTFLDQGIQNLYHAEQGLGKILSTFAALAIFISCLGIFGLASFSAERRTKEIGIRKVQGASVSNIVVLLSREFSRWVLLANLIAWPLGWYVMNKWLQNFSYRAGISPLLFVFAGLISFIIAAIPVSYQGLKAARANPADYLRYE
jgi:putative ABC transport system permease protein